jgi:hypothetical protein
MSKVYVLSGWSSVYQDPGFEMEFKTIEEAKKAAVELLEKRGQTSLRIYEAKQLYSGRRGNGDSSYVFEVRNGKTRSAD